MIIVLVQYLSNSTTLVTLGIFLELIILLVYIVPHNKLEVSIVALRFLRLDVRVHSLQP